MLFGLPYDEHNVPHDERKLLYLAVEISYRKTYSLSIPSVEEFHK
jgi:hypothetical protein